MTKKNNICVCQQCGAQSAKWMGRCVECGAWNTLVEERIPEEDAGSGVWSPPGRRGKPQAYSDLGLEQEQRLSTGIRGFDLVLGGGAVTGSLVLLAGEPGAGKSTLMLQAAANISAESPVLLVTGEESQQQVKMRGDRLGLKPKELLVFNETRLEEIIKTFDEISPRMLIVDSIQTVYSPKLSSAPGSVGQVREAAARLLLQAKARSAPVFLIGHVTKSGLIAGPKTMEHIVDTVVMLEGERFHSIRALRALKNRFGPVSEMAVFEMRADGLLEVENPSRLLLEERASGISGSAVTATVEGTRSLLIEVQALVSPTSFGPGRRTAEGFDRNRLALLLAVLERRGGLEVGDRDVYVNVVGGVRLDEPAADLAVAAAVTSSLLDKSLADGAVIVGELGLGGEVRSATAADLRCKEAKAMGMKEIYLPVLNAEKISGISAIKLHPIASLQQLLEEVFHQ